MAEAGSSPVSAAAAAFPPTTTSFTVSAAAPGLCHGGTHHTTWEGHGRRKLRIQRCQNVLRPWTINSSFTSVTTAGEHQQQQQQQHCTNGHDRRDATPPRHAPQAPLQPPRRRVAATPAKAVSQTRPATLAANEPAPPKPAAITTARMTATATPAHTSSSNSISQQTASWLLQRPPTIPTRRPDMHHHRNKGSSRDAPRRSAATGVLGPIRHACRRDAACRVLEHAQTTPSRSERLVANGCAETLAIERHKQRSAALAWRRCKRPMRN